jgi:hypothetical protein
MSHITLGLQNVKAKILQAGTSEVYGDPTVQSAGELGKCKPIGIRSKQTKGNVVPNFVYGYQSKSSKY